MYLSTMPNSCIVAESKFAEIMYIAAIIPIRFMCNNIQQQISYVSIHSLVHNIPHLQHKFTYYKQQTPQKLGNKVTGWSAF